MGPHQLTTKVGLEEIVGNKSVLVCVLRSVKPSCSASENYLEFE